MNFLRISTLFIAIMLFPLQCKIIDFKNNSIQSELSFDIVFEVSTIQNSFSQLYHCDLTDIYAGAGINPESIEDAIINDVQATILGMDTVNDTVSASISFKKMVPIISENALMNLQDIPLSTGSSVSLTPFAEQDTLSIDNEGLDKLESLLAQNPPSTIVFFLRGAIQTSPVEFTFELTFDVQLVLKE